MNLKKSCPPSLPWHKLRKPPQRVVHWKLSPPDGGHLGCGIWQRLPRFPPSPVTLCLHLQYSADPPHPIKKPFERLRRREDLIWIKNLRWIFIESEGVFITKPIFKKCKGSFCSPATEKNKFGSLLTSSDRPNYIACNSLTECNSLPRKQPGFLSDHGDNPS